MQPQILRVDNIEESIRENGLEFYVDRLIQDRMGEYYWVETETVGVSKGYEAVVFTEEEGKSIYCQQVMKDEPGLNFEYVRYSIVKIPKELAWFCIDAIKLKTQVINLGNGIYGDGPHGGDIQYFIKDGDQFKEIPVKAVRVETL